ncbi:MAG: type II toxin-antitoxin system VapC family toxin [Nitrososphaerales archaeon]|jgi:predicted nucleic acid-binding protein
MAHSRRDQEHLGIDTNVLVAYLDAGHPAHRRTERMSREAVALNPSVIHEAYHTLVFKMKWEGGEASRVLLEASADERNLFINQTLTTTRIGLQLATKYSLGGRDALILGSLLAAGIGELVTLDEELIRLKRVAHGRRNLAVRPL